MSNDSDTSLNTDKAFGLGLMFGQIAVHCEHVLAGGKLAAQLACNRDNVGLACDAIRREGCQVLVEEQDSPERVSLWIYRKAIAASLIRILDKENASSLSGAIISGKLFGYSDNEIENYVTKHFPESITAATGSEPSVLHGSGTGD
jgi:hypothetical protein